jgi:hypothetical protein
MSSRRLHIGVWARKVPHTILWFNILPEKVGIAPRRKWYGRPPCFCVDVINVQAEQTCAYDTPAGRVKVLGRTTLWRWKNQQGQQTTSYPTFGYAHSYTIA